MAVIRIGECNRCGICCIGCRYIQWTNSKIPGIEKRLIGTCTIWGTKERKEKGCDDYPQYPDRLLGKFCGYRFIDEETGKDVTQYRKNKLLYRFTHPSIDVVIRDE